MEILKRIKTFSCILAVGLITTQTMAQQNGIPRIIPPAPEAASLGIYNNTKANPNTGALNLSIPIYEIKTKTFSIPISIDYTGGSGIKVDEKASWVGLGWMLNVGGSISRTIIGNDDLTSGYRTTYVPSASEIGPGGNPVYSTYIEETLRDQRDTEPDNFFFSFNGKSGKFVFDNTGVPILIESSPLKISLNSNYEFLITDENGDRYIFREKENVSSTTNNIGNGPVGQITAAVTTWHLTEIISSNNSDTVKFKYQTQVPQVNDFSYDFSQVYGPNPYNQPTPGQCSYGIELDQQGISQHVRTYLYSRLTSIEYNLGKVLFTTTSGRSDGQGLALDKIEVYSKIAQDPFFQKLKTFKLNQDYFYSPLQNSIGFTSDLQYRLRLNSLEERDNNDLNGKIHSFEYSQVNLPPVNNFAQDEWGYFNGKTGNTSLLQLQRSVTANGLLVIGSANRDVSEVDLEAGILKKVSYPTKGFTQFNYEPNKYSFSETKAVETSITCGASGINNIQRQTFTANNFGTSRVQIEFRKINDLTGLPNRPFVRLTDLTTNTQVYTASADINNNVNFETIIQIIDGHQYELYAEALGNTSAYAIISVKYIVYQNISDIRSGFGLRVQDISNYDQNGNLITRTAYKYGANESGEGLVISNIFNRMPKSYDKYFQYGTYIPFSGLAICKFQRKVFFDSSFYPLSTLSGSPLVYSQVTVYNGEKGNSIGKTVYDYLIFSDKTLLAPANYPNTVAQLPYSWANGKLSSESIYKFEQSNYTLQKKVVTEYDERIGQEGRGLMLGYATIASGAYNSPRPLTDFYFFDYPIYTGVMLPKIMTETFYQSDGITPQTTVVKDMLYNNKYQLVKTSQISSEQKVLTTELSYPIDMVTSGNDLLGVYQGMVERNILSPIIESKVLKAGKISQWTRNNYFSPYTDIFVPSSIETFNLDNNTWESKAKFTKYSAYGDLNGIEQTGGLKTCYLYSYKNQLPVFEIKNVDYPVIESVLGGADAVREFSKSIPTTQEVNSLVSLLKNSALLQNTQITTYTYNPLVGMTSSTDAKGMTTYYEYDAFQRLKTVKDQNGHILKQTGYHYKN